MKKVIIILMIICIMLCGCGKEEPKASNVPSTTSTPIPTPTPLPDKLPMSCKYNDFSYSLDDVAYYSNKDGKNNELFIVLKLNLGDILNNEFEWFMEDTFKTEDIFDESVSTVKLTNDDNEIKTDKLARIGNLHYTDSNVLYCVYMSDVLGSYRYAFDKCSVEVNLRSKQKDKSVREISFNAEITKDDITVLDPANGKLEKYIADTRQSYINQMISAFGG